MFAISFCPSDKADEKGVVEFLGKCRAPVVFLECPHDKEPRDLADTVRAIRTVARIILTPINAAAQPNFGVRRYMARIENFAACFRHAIIGIEASAHFNTPAAGPLALKKAAHAIAMLRQRGIPSLISYKLNSGGIPSIVPWAMHFFSAPPNMFFLAADDEPSRFDWDLAANVLHNILPSCDIGLRSYASSRPVEKKVSAIKKYSSLPVKEDRWVNGGGFHWQDIVNTGYLKDFLLDSAISQLRAEITTRRQR